MSIAGRILRASLWPLTLLPETVLASPARRKQLLGRKRDAARPAAGVVKQAPE
jgi:hypothetical protein